MIQIALVGRTPVVVEEGIRKSVPDKLHILHTKNESAYKFENEAKKLKAKIEKEHKIPTFLIKVDPFDMDDIMHTILKTISKEKKSNKDLRSSDFAINITGGTKLMVAAASTAAYLAGAKVYYVMESKMTRDSDLVLELPVPPKPQDDNLGNTTKTMSIVLSKINELGKTTNRILLDKINADKTMKKKMTPQKLGYHLDNLERHGMIIIERGWQTDKMDKKTGEFKVDKKLNTITVTNAGKYYAEYPGLVGSLK